MKKLTSLILAALLLCTCAGSSLAAFSEDPTVVLTYDQYTQWPVVAEGEKVEVSVMIPRDDGYGVDYDKQWLWHFLPEATGIDFKVEQISSSAIKERRNLALASADLPDIMWGMDLGNADMVTYGDSEGLLLDLSPYLNEDVMPNLMRLLEYYPTLIADCTTPSGAVYSLPRIEPMNPGNVMNMWINKDYMEGAGITEIPNTLDEFVDMLYAMKEAFPDSTPLGGSWKSNNPMGFFVNAVGYHGTGNGTGIFIRDGEAVFAAYDDTYKEVLALFHQFYEDGIISKDFFTQDNMTNKAQILEGKVGAMPYGILELYTDADYEKYMRWEHANPLTSQWNDQKLVYRASPIKIGGFVLSADTEHAETILRFADAFFAHEALIYLHWGPQWGSGEGMGMVGGWAIENWNVKYLDVDGNDWYGVNEYLHEVTGSLAKYMGNGAFAFDYPNATPKQFKFHCFGDDIAHPQYDNHSGNGYNCLQQGEKMNPYQAPGFPTITYWTEDESYSISEWNTVLNPYMESEIAKFITGQRSLDEYADYQAELENMGMGEKQELYQEVWARYNAE